MTSVHTTIRLWDLRTHRPLGKPLTGHVDHVQDVAFTRDGRVLASGGEDGTVRLWDTRTRTQFGRLRGHTQPVESMAFSPDGRTLVSASWDGTIRLWEKILWRSDAELMTQVCNLVGSGLSRAEWAHYAAGIPYRATRVHEPRFQLASTSAGAPTFRGAPAEDSARSARSAMGSVSAP